MLRKAKAATIQTPIAKKMATGSSNRKTLRSIIIKAQGDEESNSIMEDPFSYDSGKYIEPPYHLLTLCMLRENSTELPQCVEAMVTNIDGFGFRLSTAHLSKEVQDSNKEAIDKERSDIETFLDNISYDDDITSLRKNTRRDLEDCGNAYWEIIPYLSGSGVSMIEKIEPHQIRLSPLDKESTKVDMYFYNKFTAQIDKKIVKKRFRRYIQIINNKEVYFKEYGDPRNISSVDGSVIPDDQLMSKKNEIATAVKHFKIKSNRTPYGIPRYISNLFSIYGSRSADEINFVTFQNNNIPSMMVMVSNGQLTDGSINRIEQFIETKIKGSNNRSSFLILEAEPATEDQMNPGTMKLEIKELSSSQKDDQLFQNYDKNNSDKIRRCFRLPPIFVGKAEDYNRAVAQESRKLADEQIFAPEREDFDRFMNKFLVREFGMKYHVFKSNSANVTNDEDLVKIISGAEKTGGITPNVSRMILSDILNRDIPQYDQNNIDFNPDIPLSLTMVDRAKTLGGNPSTGVLAPNQGQIPVQNSLEILRNVEKMLTLSITEEIDVDSGEEEFYDEQ